MAPCSLRHACRRLWSMRSSAIPSALVVVLAASLMQLVSGVVPAAADGVELVFTSEPGCYEAEWYSVGLKGDGEGSIDIAPGPGPVVFASLAWTGTDDTTPDDVTPGGGRADSTLILNGVSVVGRQPTGAAGFAPAVGHHVVLVECEDRAGHPGDHRSGYDPTRRVGLGWGTRSRFPTERRAAVDRVRHEPMRRAQDHPGVRGGRLLLRGLRPAPLRHRVHPGHERHRSDHSLTAVRIGRIPGGLRRLSGDRPLVPRGIRRYTGLRCVRPGGRCRERPASESMGESRSSTTHSRIRRARAWPN